MKVLIFGASGMLGNAMYRIFSESNRDNTFGTLRSSRSLAFFPVSQHAKLLTNVNVENVDSLTSALAVCKPDVIINCIGLVKQIKLAHDPLQALTINSMLPHRLSRLAEIAGARFVHISTDCVFAGSSGGYKESDFADANDLYGRSKYLGEVINSPHAITLRTSIIGHELESNHSLLNWFLSREDNVSGFTKAIFSGIPTVELARVIKSFVLPNPHLHGLYHVAAKPINKNDLLQLIAECYGKNIEIIPDSQLVIDRSLDGSSFNQATGYICPEWPELIARMRSFG